MALATLYEALPNTLSTTAPAVPHVQGGLAARASSLIVDMRSLVAVLDPEDLSGRDAAALYGDFAHLERLVTAAKTLLAPRIADTGHWKTQGHSSPASLLATLEGGTAGQAKQTLETGQRLSSLPSTEEALRSGTLSGPKAAEITRAAALEPSAESDLLAGSADQPLHVIKERCAEVRATSARNDPLATLAKIHTERSFSSWIDVEGAFCFKGRDTAERGARLMAHLNSTANRLRSDRWAAARSEAAAVDLAAGGTGAKKNKGPKWSKTGSGSNDTSDPSEPPAESEAALRADAFYLLMTRRAPSAPSAPRAPAGPSDIGAGGIDTDATTDLGIDLGIDLGSPDDLITAPPPATVMVRVDLEALRRGTALPGELCSIDGQGPVPVAVVKNLMNDAFLAVVFVEAGDIKAISHLGRNINAQLRTALVFRDRGCVVPGCGVLYSLEIDHVISRAEGGLTDLPNLALLCHHHHHLKTYDGWVLQRNGPSDQDPRWSFRPQPEFGQEPGLGIDKPPEPVART